MSILTRYGSGFGISIYVKLPYSLASLNPFLGIYQGLSLFRYNRNMKKTFTAIAIKKSQKGKFPISVIPDVPTK